LLGGGFANPTLSVNGNFSGHDQPSISFIQCKKVPFPRGDTGTFARNNFTVH
jgi:hypothetical protein